MCPLDLPLGYLPREGRCVEGEGLKSPEKPEVSADIDFERFPKEKFVNAHVDTHGGVSGE